MLTLHSTGNSRTHRKALPRLQFNKQLTRQTTCINPKLNLYNEFALCIMQHDQEQNYIKSSENMKCSSISKVF